MYGLGYIPTKHCDESNNLPVIPVLSRNSLKISHYGKLKQKTKYNVKIYETDNKQKLNSLYEKLLHRQALYKSLLGEDFSKFISRIKYNHTDNLIIKKIPCKNLKYFYSGLKEVTMMYKIFVAANDKNVKIVPKLYFASPLYSNSKWYYIIVMEKIHGMNVDKLNTVFNKVFNKIIYNKHQLIEITKKSLHILWSLGFSHNDLHGGNVIYNSESNTIYFIDFETTVMHTQEDIIKFNNHVEKHNDIMSAYLSVYKDASVSLINLSSRYTISYADNQNLIYNTDDWLIPLLNDIL
jgi:predicted Ser/Thr protein kinase